MTTLKNFLLVIFLLVTASKIRAESVVYSCSYNHGNKVEYIGTNNIRQNIVAKKESKGLIYTFVIADTSNFSELNDYVIIENSRGQTITYALSCK